MDIEDLNLKIALVHEWLTVAGGSESCFKEMVKMFPEADIYALVADENCLDALNISKERVRTSFIQRLPFATKKWKSYLPLFPLAIESFDLSEYDVIISSSHAVAKGVITNCNQIHVCYIYSPMRYAWDLSHRYLKEAGLRKGLKGVIAHYMLHRLRIWDLISANRVDAFLPISNYISKRVESVYRRDSYRVIYPPVAVHEFTLQKNKEEFYLAASRLVPYKRLDLIVDAFRLMPDKKLVVIGDGPDKEKINQAAKIAPNVEFLGYQPFDILKSHMQRAKAFVFAADEDFGIIPIEAQACGTPIIAFGRGGSLETVHGCFVGEELNDDVTGIFFSEQTESAIVEAVYFFEKHQVHFSPEKIREFVLRFSEDQFINKFKQSVLEIIENFRK